MNGILGESIARLIAPGRPRELDLSAPVYRGLPLPQPSDAIEILRQQPQREMPVTHRFQAGVYIREILMPADTWVVGHVHKTKHWNVVVSGHALVSIDGAEPKEIGPGDVFESEAGAQKWLYIFAEEPGAAPGSADMRFITIHGNPDNERDIATLEEGLLSIPEALQVAKGGLTVDEFRMSVTRTLTS